MRLLVNKKDLEEILFSNITTLDMEYYELTDQEIVSFLETSDSNYYRYDKFDISTKSISDLIYIAFEEMEKFIYQKYNIKLNLNLIIKPILVYYVVFNIIYHVRQKGFNIDYMDEYEVEDILIDAFNYAGLSEFISDAINYLKDDNKFYEIHETVTITVLTNIKNKIRAYIGKFVIENISFMKLIQDAENIYSDMFVLLIDMLLLPRFKNFNTSIILNKNPYDVLKESKEFYVDVILIKIIVVGELNGNGEDKRQVI